jgi:ferredoxin
MSDTQTINRNARQTAVNALDTVRSSITGLVEYQSSGRVLVIGNGDPAIFAVSCLPEDFSGQILQIDKSPDPDHVTIPADGRAIAISGHLGNFTLTLGERGTPVFQTLSADIIVDICDPPLLSMPVKPPGYACSGEQFTDIEIAVAGLTDLTGTFEKPRYFDYDASICAHGRVGQIGCNRCVEACPTDAITALVETVEVDPYRCQGGGICATVCPTGAIRYTYPDIETQINRLRTLLRVYAENGGTQAVVVFIAEGEAESIELADNMLLVSVEELASSGAELWLSALAFGASQVVLAGSSVPDSVTPWLNEQIVLCEHVITAAGLQARSIVRVEAIEDLNPASTPPHVVAKATYGGLNNKRNMLFAAIEALCGTTGDIIDLPTGSPFGRIHVNNETCTLCMACTSVCPANAVVAGGDTPALKFHEHNCVQCGICERACPEHAISLQARLNLDHDERHRAVTLNEQAPFLCVSCGKPFAIRNVIDLMLDKLKDHPMFSSERAKRRLMMCDDCRVVDVVQDDDMMNPDN